MFLCYPVFFSSSLKFYFVFSITFSIKNICVVRHLKHYLERTSSLRDKIDSLFVTTVKPYRPATLNTISNWVKFILKSAGIDVKLASAGSTRAASTSKALEAGAPLDTILNAAGWSRPSTFARFYHKKLMSTQNMGSYVLEGTQV